MKSRDHLLVTMCSFGIILWYYISYFDILTHPYMVFLIIALFIIGGWNFGVGLAKFLKEIKNG